jgi:hypothetical protein
MAATVNANEVEIIGIFTIMGTLFILTAFVYLDKVSFLLMNNALNFFKGAEEISVFIRHASSFIQRADGSWIDFVYFLCHSSK